MFNLVEISVRLRQERKKRSLNQADFGKLGGVGLQTQSRYEKAETEPGAGYLAGLAESGVDVMFILTGSRSLGPQAAGDAEALEALSTLAAPVRETLIAHIVEIVRSYENK